MAGSERWIFTRSQLEQTPSRKNGIDAEKELNYRQQAANFIQDMGQRLQVTQLCINTAIVYMHRFYMFHSFHKFHRNSIASACLFLAAKVEEQPRKLEHVIKVSHMCLFRESGPLDAKSEAYLEKAQELVVNENILLQTLGFDVSVDHPHSQVLKTCQLVRASKDLAQTSYFLATNSLHLTTLCLQHPPAFVSCVCIHLACKWSNWEIPRSSEGKDWFWYADKNVTLERLEDLTREFLTILDKCPSKLKKKIMKRNEEEGGMVNLASKLKMDHSSDHKSSHSKPPSSHKSATATLASAAASGRRESPAPTHHKESDKKPDSKPELKPDVKQDSFNSHHSADGHKKPSNVTASTSRMDPSGGMRRVKTEPVLKPHSRESLTHKEYLARKKMQESIQSRDHAVKQPEPEAQKTNVDNKQERHHLDILAALNEEEGELPPSPADPHASSHERHRHDKHRAHPSTHKPPHENRHGNGHAHAPSSHKAGEHRGQRDPHHSSSRPYKDQRNERHRAEQHRPHPATLAQEKPELREEIHIRVQEQSEEGEIDVESPDSPNLPPELISPSRPITKRERRLSQSLCGNRELRVSLSKLPDGTSDSTPSPGRESKLRNDLLSPNSSSSELVSPEKKGLKMKLSTKSPSGYVKGAEGERYQSPHGSRDSHLKMKFDLKNRTASPVAVPQAETSGATSGEEYRLSSKPSGGLKLVLSKGGSSSGSEDHHRHHHHKKHKHHKHSKDKHHHSHRHHSKKRDRADKGSPSAAPPIKLHISTSQQGHMVASPSSMKESVTSNGGMKDLQELSQKLGQLIEQKQSQMNAAPPSHPGQPPLPTQDSRPPPPPHPPV